MDRYLERAKKLRAKLKMFDMNGNGVVELWCAECKKDCKDGSKNHTKAHIDNLFNIHYLYVEWHSRV
jgi:hypothetical protein